MFSMRNCHWKKERVCDYLYRSPSQNQSEFEHFLLSLENLLCNIRSKDPAFKILLGDFNSRSKSWWVHDITNNEGTQIESISSLYGFFQLISEPTHILQNSSSCIDFIFTSELNHHFMRIVFIKSHMPNLTCKWYILHLTKDLFRITNMSMQAQFKRL